MSNTFMQYSDLLPIPVIINRKPKYKIYKIVDSKIDCQRVYKLLYKIIQLGYKNTEDNSKWLSAIELNYA